MCNFTSRAIQFLEPATRYEAAADFQPQLRGLAYLRLGARIAKDGALLKRRTMSKERCKTSLSRRRRS